MNSRDAARINQAQNDDDEGRDDLLLPLNDDDENESKKLETFLLTRVRGIPSGYVMRSRDAWQELGTSRTTWNAWVIEGLPVTQPGTSAEMVLTDDLIEWLRKHRTLDKPKSQRQTGRKK